MRHLVVFSRSDYATDVFKSPWRQFFFQYDVQQYELTIFVYSNNTTSFAFCFPVYRARSDVGENGTRSKS